MAAPVTPQPAPQTGMAKDPIRSVQGRLIRRKFRRTLITFIKILIRIGVLLSPVARSTAAKMMLEATKSVGAQTMAK